MGRPSSTACYCYFYYYYASSKIKKQGSLRWWVTFDCPISFFFSGRPSALLSNGKSSYLTQRKKNVEETEHQKLRDVLYFKRCDGRRERWQMTAMLPPFKYRGRSTMCGSATRPSSAICWVLLFFFIEKLLDKNDIPSFDWHVCIYRGQQTSLFTWEKWCNKSRVYSVI